MKTYVQNKNRLTSETYCTDSNSNNSMQSMVWHIALHNRISQKDCQYLSSLHPEQCSLFVLKDSHVVFQSESLSNNFTDIQNEIDFSYDATYTQNVYLKENGLLRILTIPICDNILIGLVSPAGLESLTTIEDAFLHKVHFIQREYFQVVQSINEMKQLTEHLNPILVINRSDDQLIGWNDSTLSFFNLSQKDLLDVDLQFLQKNCPKASQRKMLIKNCTVGNIDCSVVQYTLKTSDKFSQDIIREELQTHAEYLLQHYQELQTNKNTDPEFIESKIVEVNRCYQQIRQLHNKEEKK